MLIEVDIRSYWRSGTGAGETGGIDALCAVDHEGFPYLPGRHLKGLLRDAMLRAVDLRGFGSELPKTLFGELSFTKDAEEADGAQITRAYARTQAGLLRVDSARLPEDDRNAILSEADPATLIKGLFRTVQTTAMNPDTGAAKHRSLRTEQVVVPLKLHFEVSGPEGDWETQLPEVLPLIRAVGQKRTRGLGRARMRVLR